MNANEFKKLLRFAMPYQKLALFSFIMLLAMVIFDLAVPRLVGFIIDRGIQQKDLAVVISTSAIMLGISLFSALVAVLNSVSSIRVGESIARDLREAIFVKIQNFSYGNIDRFSTAKLMVRLTSDTAAVQRVFQMSLRIGARAPLSMIGSIVLMFVTSRTLALSMMPIFVVCGIVIFLFSTKLEPFFRIVQQRLDRLNTILQENIAGARLVKAFVREKHEEERIGEANANLARENVKVMQLMAFMSPILTLLIDIGIVLVVWLGGLQTIRGDLTLGQIVAFTNYLMATLHPLTHDDPACPTPGRTALPPRSALTRCSDAEPEVSERPDALTLPSSIKGEVEFDRVGFHYNGEMDTAVLEDIYTRIEPGKTTAVLGATGSGKSSLVGLIPRFYDTSAGSVRIDSRDVRTLKSSSILEHVSVVPQDTVLFSGTLRDNIRYGRPGATEEEVVGAAIAAQAHDFILNMPMQYDSHVEERGSNLSGGQKQRIAITRALVCRSSILILDEATSSVDTRTELRIQRALLRLMAGRTSIVIAHRLSTIRDADRILVINDGQIVEQGKHDELLKQHGFYYHLYMSQFKGNTI